MFKSSLVAGLLGLSAQVYAQVSRVCPSSSDICYSINIPQATANDGQGDIFLQITAPTSLSWVALGQGRSMSNANVFVIYSSANGNNVTLSPRLSTGEREPTYTSSTQVTLLEGSGISNGVMTANIRCSNCNSWSGGSMDFTSSSTNWIHASLSGNALNSDSTSATISQHSNDYGSFSWSLASAKGGDSVNPFLNSNTGGTTGGSGSSCVPRPTSAGANAATTTTWPSTMPTAFSSAWPTAFPSSWRSSWPTAYPTGKRNDDSNDDNSNDKRSYMAIINRQTVNYCNDNNNAITIIGSGGISKTMLIAHGILASLAFVIFFPIGAISIRLFSFPGLVWFHAAFQCLAYLLYIAGFGVGVYIAQKGGYMSESHPIIGIVCFVLLFFQPILGFLHHASFKKIGGRGAWSHAHLWLGRGVITLGIINGGLGLKLANNTDSGKIAYAVIAAVVWIVWVAAAVWGEVKRSKAPPKYDGTSPVHSDRDHSLDGLRPEHNGYYGRQGSTKSN